MTQQSISIHALYDRGLENKEERWTAVLGKYRWSWRLNREVKLYKCLTVDDDKQRGHRHSDCVLGPWLGTKVAWSDIPKKIRKIIAANL